MKHITQMSARGGCIAAAAILLSACGQAGNYIDEHAALTDQIDALKSAGIAGEDHLPASGSATYNGVMTFSNLFTAPEGEDTAILYADATIEADFLPAGGRFEGLVTDIRDINDDLYAGDLEVSGGVIDPTTSTDIGIYSGVSMAATLEGVLHAPNIDRIEVTGDLGGNLWGEEAELVDLSFDGVWTRNGVTSGLYGEMVLSAE